MATIMTDINWKGHYICPFCGYKKEYNLTPWRFFSGFEAGTFTVEAEFECSKCGANYYVEYEPTFISIYTDDGEIEREWSIG